MWYGMFRILRMCCNKTSASFPSPWQQITKFPLCLRNWKDESPQTGDDCFFVCWVVVIYLWEKPRSHLQRWNLYFLKMKISILWLINGWVFYKHGFIFSPNLYFTTWLFLNNMEIPLTPFVPGMHCPSRRLGWCLCKAAYAGRSCPVRCGHGCDSTGIINT